MNFLQKKLKIVLLRKNSRRASIETKTCGKVALYTGSLLKKIERKIQQRYSIFTEMRDLNGMKGPSSTRIQWKSDTTPLYFVGRVIGFSGEWAW